MAITIYVVTNGRSNRIRIFIIISCASSPMPGQAAPTQLQRINFIFRLPNQEIRSVAIHTKLSMKIHIRPGAAVSLSPPPAPTTEKFINFIDDKNVHRLQSNAKIVAGDGASSHALTLSLSLLFYLCLRYL